jgi:DNA-binding NarL/FixJ family response regulator
MPKPDWKPLPTLSGPFQTLRSWNSSLLNFDGIQPPTCSQSKRPDCRIIVLTDTEDEDVLLEAVEVGAAGFLTKSSSLSELIETIRSVMRGETIIPPHLLSGVLRRLISQRILQDQARRQRQRLTRRGKQALALLAKGASSEAIAEELTISPQTARTHVQNVLSKLCVHSRLEAAAFITKNRILSELHGVDA